MSIPIKYNKIIIKPVCIENDVWIGCGCRLLGGTIIKTRTIFAAGAVINNRLYESGYIYGGVPAKKIKGI